MLRGLPPASAWVSALVAAIVGFGGTIALVIQALTKLGASGDQAESAVTALCIGIAAAGAFLSFRLRMPVVLAWSTPGAALLAAAQPGFAWPVAAGIFLSAGIMMVMVGPSQLLRGWLSGFHLPSPRQCWPECSSRSAWTCSGWQERTLCW